MDVAADRSIPRRSQPWKQRSTRLTLRCNGNDKVRANELARCILRLASEGERDAVRLHDHALAALAPAMVWRDAQPSEFRT